MWQISLKFQLLALSANNNKIDDVYKESQKPEWYIYKRNELYKTTKNRTYDIQNELSQRPENEVRDICIEDYVESKEDGTYY